MRQFIPDEAEELPRRGGVYVLVLECARPLRLRVGALGWLRFEPGYYCYVGSARGGLAGRIARHARRSGKKKRWHVDYLRAYTAPVAVFCQVGPDADECALSDAVARLAEMSVPGFGSSDCRCASHLHYLAESPVRRLARLHPH
ncbi:MAG: GIY-YIG nuclease family protein [Planctomycetota bacterium]|jgi:sugar fermentation stimulation protein A